MKTPMVAMGIVMVLCGCSKEPPAPAKTAAAADSPADDRQAMQELQDLGYTPQMVLRLVRGELEKKQTELAVGAPAEKAGPGVPAAETPAQPAVNNGAAISEPAVAMPAPPAPVAPAPEKAPPPPPPPPPPPQPAPVTIVNEVVVTNVVVTAPVVQNVTYFYDYMAPYGRWVEVTPYGRVWQPYVTVSDGEWRPYCNAGYWTWTDSGWYWNSSYSWGWAPFHYGRWCYMAG